MHVAEMLGADEPLVRDEDADAYMKVVLVLTAVLWFAALTRGCPAYTRGMADACVLVAAAFPVVTVWMRTSNMRVDWRALMPADRPRAALTLER